MLDEIIDLLGTDRPLLAGFLDTRAQHFFGKFLSPSVAL
jgi:hypothetical protein